MAYISTMGLKKNIDYSTEIIDAYPGQTIEDFIIQLSKEASEFGIEKITGRFNGIILEITPETFKKEKQEELIQFYHSEMNKRAEEYRKSPKGIKAAKEAEERKNNLQDKANQLIGELDNLDFSNFESVLDWISKFQNPSDHTGVSFDKNKVIKIFEENGFYIGMNTGDDFDENNPENFAKYIVGQALDGIDKIGAIHHMAVKFSNDWKEKFGEKTNKDKQRIKELEEEIRNLKKQINN